MMSLRIMMILLGLLIAPLVHAASFSYEGVLSLPSGEPVTTAVNIRLKIFGDLGATCELYSQEFTNITPDPKGFFALSIDGTGTIPAGIIAAGASDLSRVFNFIDAAICSNSTERFIQLEADLDGSGSASTYDAFPVTKVESVPFAMTAQTLADQGATSGQILKWNATSKSWNPAADEDNGIVQLTGDVTTPGAGDGTTIIANDAITTAKIADSSVSLAKMANLPATSLIGNSTGATAVPASITIGSGLSLTGGVLSSTAGGGSVTSVAMSVPSILTISGSPISGAGTLAVDLATQAQNTVFVGPTTGANAAPTFRALVPTDLPDLDTAKITTGYLNANRISAGGVTNTEFNYLAGVTSGIQAQIDAKLPKAGGTMSGNLVMDNQTGILLREASGNGTNDITIKAPTLLGASYNLILPVDDGTTGQVLSTDGFGTLSWASSGGGGSVTNVDLSVPSIMSVSGGPITSSGTLAVSLATQNANLVFAGPTSGGAVAPAFRGLVANDIPSLDGSKITTGSIDAARISAGGVSNTEFDYLDGVTSAIQTQVDAKLPKAGGTMSGNLVMDNATGVLLREASGNGTNDITIKAPTLLGASFSLTLPAADGSPGQALTTNGSGVLGWTTTGGGGTVTSVAATDGTISVGGTATDPTIGVGAIGSSNITDGSILNADINASAGIVDTKLATIDTAGKVANSATTATSANTANSIVSRDPSGDFLAGTIFANLTGSSAASGNLVLDSTSHATKGNVLLNPTSGFVGIGTSSPTNSLSFSGNAARTIALERHTTANTAGSNLTLGAGGATTGATNKNGGKLILSSGTSTGTGSSSIEFQTSAAGGSGTANRLPTTVMSILGDGSVGIGTSTPTSLVQVRGTANSTNAIEISMGGDSASYNAATTALNLITSSSGGSALGASSVNGWQMRAYSDWYSTGSLQNAMQIGYTTNTTPSAYPMTLLPTGNIGIGISPSSRLDVNGALTIRESGAPALAPVDQGRIYFDSTTNKFKVSEHNGAYVDLVSSGSVTNVSASAPLSSSGGATPNITLGTVPIASGGTNSTTALSNNRIMVSSTGAIVEASALTNGQLLIGSTGALPVAAAITGSNGVSIANGAGTIDVATNGATTNTNSTLVMRDGTGGFSAGAISALGLTLSNTTVGTGLVLQGSTSGNVTLRAPTTVTNYTMTMPNAAPAIGNMLTAINTAGDMQWTAPLTSASAYINGGNTFGGIATIGTNDAFPLELETGGSTRLSILTDGKVGIGTAPTEKLHVNGGSIRVQNGAIYSDHVDLSAASTADFANSNSASSSYDCAANVTLQNMKSGGNYTLIITGTGTAQCNFTSAGDTFRFLPSNSPRIAASHTIYSFFKAGTTVYVNWSSGY